MKKQLVAYCVYWLFLSTAFLSRGGLQNQNHEMADQEIYAEKQINAVNKKKIAKCINTKDKKGLKSLFSKNAQEESEEIDNRISELISAFNGAVVLKEKVVV